MLFEKGTGMPYRIAALHRLGQHSGPQHIGYHGGVSLEEMFVPLALYGPAERPGAPLSPPTWWDDGTGGSAAPIGDRNDVRVRDAVTTARSNDVEAPAAAAGSFVVPPPQPSSTLLNSATNNGAAANIRERCRAVLASDAKLLAIFDHIAAGESLDAAQLGRVASIAPGRVRLNVVGLRDKLEAAGIEAPIALEDEPFVVRWVGPR